MAVVSMKQLLEAGVHFGHQTRRWNPKMRRFIFTERNGIHIIDLQKTVIGLEEAYRYSRDLATNGEKMLFVGTKKQAQEAVQNEAARAGQFYVNQRWLGGLLTNFKTIQERLRRLDELERMKQTGEMDLRPKKEQLKLQDEMNKLNRLLGGIRTMRRLPAALFIVDCEKEHLAVHEASRLDIPIVALVDTNADPDPVAYPIPANDDAIRAVRLLAGKIADATIEGQQMREAMLAEQALEAEEEMGAGADEAELAAPLSTDVGEVEGLIATDETEMPAGETAVPGITETPSAEQGMPVSVEAEESSSVREGFEAEPDGMAEDAQMEITEQASAPEVAESASEAEQNLEQVESPSAAVEAAEGEGDHGAEAVGTEIGQDEPVPQPVGETDLSELEPVVPMSVVDGLEPLPDMEGDTRPDADDLPQVSEVEEAKPRRKRAVK